MIRVLPEEVRANLANFKVFGLKHEIHPVIVLQLYGFASERFFPALGVLRREKDSSGCVPGINVFNNSSCQARLFNFLVMVEEQDVVI